VTIPSAVFAVQTDTRGKQFENGKAGENGKAFKKGNGSGFSDDTNDEGTRGECERALARSNARDEATCQDPDGDGLFEIVPNDSEE
jgi:hypothetical protein